MKKIIHFIIILIALSNSYSAQTYPSLNINMLAHLTPETDNTGSDGRKYSGCWGWFQSAKNKEYAIVGTSKQTYFIDVTNPSLPVIVDSVRAKHTGCTWREIKTYQNYCYMVSDQCQPNSLQIVDMQYLPDSVHVVHDNNTIFEICHTIFIDKDKLYCGSVKNSAAMGGSYSTMRVYSLATPSVPVLVRSLEQDVSTSVIDVVHDMFVRNDTIYASCGFKGFQVLKLTATNTFSLMQSFTSYPYAGYNHSSWQTDDRKTMVFADEVPAGTPAKVINVSNLNNITVLDTINSHTLATPHNPYIIGNNWCWISTYQDGLYLYDISTPSNTTIYGYFDTSPLYGVNDNFSTSAYRGNWGAYPYLPSKIIIACDMQNGIFILKGNNTYESTTGIKENEMTELSTAFSVFPNPANDQLYCIIANQTNKNLQFSITDVLGKTVMQETLNITNMLYKGNFNTERLSNGCYFVTIKGDNIHETKKILIQK
ncbi:MAG: choice-of-anchor B family protein [Burkholderiales bacterium]|nr:choice-of-anchor B family protein [Bacteroidia bacterium]